MVKPAPDNVRRRSPLADHRALYNGFGNAMGQAIEFVGAPLIFLFFGRWLDHRLGTQPFFMLGLFLVALLGVCVSTYYRYKENMEKEEEGKPWKRT